jgi:hypothetical protein
MTVHNEGKTDQKWCENDHAEKNLPSDTLENRSNNFAWLGKENYSPKFQRRVTEKKLRNVVQSTE